MALRIADLGVDKVYVGADPVTAIYVGADQVWSSFSAQGMDKSGSQNPNATLAKLVGFTARSGASVINDGLVVAGAGTALIEGSVNFSNGASSNHNARIYLNGSLLQTGTTFSGTGVGTVSVEAQPLAAGDVLELWAFSSLNSRSNVAAASTFLTITPAAT